MFSSLHWSTVMLLSLIVLALISTTNECTPMAPGQGRTMNFSVSGFTLPAAMAYSTMVPVQSQVPQIAKTAGAAITLVRSLIIQAVTAVLEQQGRNALLPSFLISAILDQLTVDVNYMPLECQVAYTTTANQANGMQGHCFIIDGIVTTLCMAANCNPGTGANLLQIPQQHLMISGSVTTTNLIMAGWSSQMWRSVFNRALEMVRQGPFGTNFAGASVAVM